MIRFSDCSDDVIFFFSIRKIGVKSIARFITVEFGVDEVIMSHLEYTLGKNIQSVSYDYTIFSDKSSLNVNVKSSGYILIPNS